MERVIVGVLVLGLTLACQPTGFSIVTAPPPATKQPPVPSAFEAEEDPPLEETDQAGLFYAPALGPNVYFYEPDELWYRYAYRRWYQAFRWNGSWFILEDPPDVLAKRELIRPKLPELPAD